MTIATYLNHNGFSEEEARKIASCFEPLFLNKGDYFVKANQEAQYLGFLESGMLQFYTENLDGLEITTYVSLPNNIVASIYSFLNNSPASENIMALLPSKIWVINKSELLKLRGEFTSFNNFYIGLLEWQICCIDKNRFDLITLSAEQRYEKLLLEEPEIFQTVPLQYIASLLGITPRHLSRLRAKK